jgi:hypothetical protein
MQRTLRTVPFQIDAEAIALGLLDMFSDDELTVLRFGMIPAVWMERTRAALNEKFRSVSTNPTGTCDECTALCEYEDHRRLIDFSMLKLLDEAQHEIALALYKHGNLVV